LSAGTIRRTTSPSIFTVVTGCLCGGTGISSSAFFGGAAIGRLLHRDSNGETMRPVAGAQKYSSGNRASRRAVAAASFGFNFLLAATKGLIRWEAKFD